jgi:hypothetical protein
MKVTGAVFWEGISLLTGEPIVAIATGLEGGSSNAKTGPIDTDVGAASGSPADGREAREPRRVGVRRLQAARRRRPRLHLLRARLASAR